MEYPNSLKFANQIAAATCLLVVTLSFGFPKYAGAQVPGARTSEPSSEFLVRLPAHTVPQVLDGRAMRVSHYNPDQMLRLVLAIWPPHMPEEEQLIRDLQTKGSPNFHQFLSAEEWDARFAPSVEDEQKVVDWAQSQGLTVTNRYSHRLIVDLEGTAGTIEKAFGVTINNYQLGDELDFANDRDPSLPQSLSGIVYSVQGLNNIQREHGSKPGSERIKGPDYSPGPVVDFHGEDHKDADPSKATYQLDANSEPVPNLSNGKMDPSDLYSSQTYNWHGLQRLSHCCNVHNDSTGSPAVSSIAIVGFGDFLASDIAGFASAYGLAYNWTSYTIAGPPGCNKGQTPPCATGETTQDIEWSIATANSFGSYNTTSHVYIYLGGNGANSTARTAPTPRCTAIFSTTTRPAY
jgi:subtilase family serine protease